MIKPFWRVEYQHGSSGEWNKWVETDDEKVAASQYQRATTESFPTMRFRLVKYEGAVVEGPVQGESKE